ncbi:MAG: UDP-N-acetylmuramoyl-L-alanine--D-glutamate ligase [Bdellovibrionales bacterium]
MRRADLKNKTIVIWGVGREGKAAAGYIRQQLPDQTFTFVDENPQADKAFMDQEDRFFSEKAQIEAALASADVIIKSPGVSVYHPLLSGKKTTSLLNLWLAEPPAAQTICITGTKGKSTTSALLFHTLNALGKKAALLGNIGVPVTEYAAQEKGFVLIEVSSYQAATLTETCDVGVVVSLYPEHLDWHNSLQTYYRDKLNLLAHSKTKIIGAKAQATAEQKGIAVKGATLFDYLSGFHVDRGQIYDKTTLLGSLRNTHLSRAHNLVNVCAVLAVLKQLGIDPKDALPKMETFSGLPHRQQELKEKDGILFVDDSISTTPQSAIAAMEVYAGRPITLLVGGFDRGIDYAPLIDYVLKNNVNAVICLGKSGQRIYEQLTAPKAFLSASLQEAVALAKEKTPKGGVVLLSPAAPSYGLFKNFEERGRVFAELVNQG